MGDEYRGGSESVQKWAVFRLELGEDEVRNERGVGRRTTGADYETR